MTLVNAMTGEIVPTLEDLEVVIERGLASFVEVGTALMQIRDERLYRTGHDTFEAYCRERWGFGRTYAHRVIESAEVVQMLPIGNTPKPTNEAQARALTPIKDKPSQMAEAMQRASDETGGKPTAEAIASVVTEMLVEEKSKQATKAEDAAALAELSTLAEQAGFDMDEKRRQRLGRFASLCRDLGKFDLDGFVPEQGSYLKERHITYAENAYAVLDEFLLTVREEKP